MSLTGVPLLLVSIAVTLAAVGLAVRWWARGDRQGDRVVRIAADVGVDDDRGQPCRTRRSDSGGGAG